MMNCSSTGLLHEHVALTRLALQFINAGRHKDADYVLGILRTDAAEANLLPEGITWLRPGQAAPAGWPIYEAALRWSRGGFGRSRTISGGG
jgi:hypothetical protein